MKFDKFSDTHFDESITIREVVEKYLIHYKWFILSVLVFLGLAFLKIYFEAPKYHIAASILIKEPERGRSISDIQGFEDLGLFGVGDNNLYNELQILKSRKLMTQVVKELRLNIRFFEVTDRYDKEIYPDYPFNVFIGSDSTIIDHINTSFQVLVKNDKEFLLKNALEKEYGTQSFSRKIEVDLGNEDMSNLQSLRIEPNESFLNTVKGKWVKVIISPIDVVVNYYMAVLNIEPVDERFSNVLNLFMDDNVKAKGIAIINNLIEQYNADGIRDKDLLAQTTIDFLNKRIELIASQLSAIENTAAQFKSKKGLVEVNSGASIYMQSSTAAEQDLVAANNRLQIVNFMLEELDKIDLSTPLPGNIGLEDMSIVNLITQYNELVLKRNRILKSSSEKNPIIVTLNSQLESIKNNLRAGLINQRSSISIQIEGISKNRQRISSRIASVPKNEKEYLDIIRERETKNALYLFLLQKREESVLSNAVKIEKAKVIDRAYSNGIPVSPKKIVTFLGAFIIGLVVPFLIIYIKDLLDTKVHNEKDLKGLPIPYLGDVPSVSSKNKLFINEADNSKIAEAFRFIRTNIGFMLDSKEKGKTVLITSTQSEEGKTFTAINLASSLAISGKKTILVGMDLRAPRISKYLGLKKMNGVTNYIKNKDLDIKDITNNKTGVKNLHIIDSGDIPPNPVEMLMSKRVAEIFKILKSEYEFIVVDTAPVGMVTDTVQISRFADLIIYVIRANVLDKRMLHIPERLFKEKKFKNMAMLINGTEMSKGAYGYGYGYGRKKKPWYKRLFG